MSEKAMSEYRASIENVDCLLKQLREVIEDIERLRAEKQGSRGRKSKTISATRAELQEAIDGEYVCGPVKDFAERVLAILLGARS